MHPLYGAGSLAFIQFLHGRLMGLGCLGTTGLAIVAAETLHLSMLLHYLSQNNDCGTTVEQRGRVDGPLFLTVNGSCAQELAIALVISSDPRNKEWRDFC